MVTDVGSVGTSANAASGVQADNTAARLAAEARTGGALDADTLAANVSQLGNGNPALTRDLAQQVEGHLSPVERGQFARALDGAANDNAAAPATPGGGAPLAAPAAPTTDPVKLGLDLGQMALDLGGIVDPFGVADGLNAAISVGRSIGSVFSGNWGEAGGHLANAGISVLGIAAGLGDLAKAGKIGKWAETVSDSIAAASRNPAAREALEPALRKVKDAVDAIPQGALDKLPQSVRESIEGMKRQLDEFFAPAARQVPGGGLAAHEAAGGHLISRHVGKTEADLQARLAADPKISGASSFRTLDRAEEVVGEALGANQQKIADWLAGNGNRLVVNHTTGSSTGISVARGAASAEDVNSVRLVLQRDPSISAGYRIVTGYPTAP